MDRRVHSSVVIGRMLASEGFTPQLQTAIKKYNRQQLKAAEHRLKVWLKSKKAFSEMVSAKGFTEAERLILGRYMGMFARINFDAGLKVGLMCRINNDSIEVAATNTSA